MDRYTIHCTESQTRKVFELGAPLQTFGYGYSTEINNKTLNNNRPSIIEKDDENYSFLIFLPTAEQMIGWLRIEHNIRIEFYTVAGIPIYDVKHNDTIIQDSMFEHNLTYHEICIANTLAAIDAALEYLESLKQ